MSDLWWGEAPEKLTDFSSEDLSIFRSGAVRPKSAPSRVLAVSHGSADVEL